MTIIYTGGVYKVNAENADRIELIQEMALAIHQLSQDDDADNHRSPIFEKRGLSIVRSYK